MQAEPLRCRPYLPKAEHGLPAATDPVECDLGLLKQLSQFEPEDVSEKCHGALQIADGQVTFKKIANRDYCFDRFLRLLCWHSFNDALRRHGWDDSF